MRHRLHADDPDREQALHRRAAAFFVDTGDIENAFGHLLMAGEEAEAFELLRSRLVDAFIQGDGRVLHRLAAKVGTEAATGEPGRLADLALALAASAPAGQAAPWIIRANNRAGDFDDADRARLVIARSSRRGAVRRSRRGRTSTVRLSRTEGPPRRRGRSVRAHPPRAHPAVARRSQRRTRDLRANLGSARRTKPAAGRNDRRARLGCVRRRSAHRGRAPRGTGAHGCRINRTGRASDDGRRGSHAGASGVRARRSRHGRTRARAVALDERGRASRLRAREPAVALESLARRRPSRRGTRWRRASASVPATRLHQSAPRPLSRIGRPHRNRDR